jgi:predicted transcriptional regulator
MPKGQLNVRLSDDGRARLEALAERYGLSKGATIEMLIRDRAIQLQQTEGLKWRRRPADK